MPYLFNPLVVSSLHESFESAIVARELVEVSDPEKKDYFYIAFQNQVSAVFENGLIDFILSGDKTLTEKCNKTVLSEATVELGFRWKASLNGNANIIFQGFCIKLIYIDCKANMQNRVIQKITDLMVTENLIKPGHSLTRKLLSAGLKVLLQGSCFYRAPHTTLINPAIIEIIKSYIASTIAPIMPAYLRENESGINPAYQDASDIRAGLFLNQKKIWMLRADFILAVGNKNAYWVSFSERGLPEVISPTLHRFINWNDRYGHPSLACPYEGYNGSAIYAGLLAQRHNYFEVYTSSGRYYRNDIQDHDKKILEAYLAYLFQQSFGNQTIIFREAPSNLDYAECSIFYNDEPLPDHCFKREYDFETITKIFEGVVQSMQLASVR